jgi:hypothetical protein
VEANAISHLHIEKDTNPYRLECSGGLEVHNIVTAIMEEYHLDLRGAMFGELLFLKKIDRRINKLRFTIRP